MPTAPAPPTDPALAHARLRAAVIQAEMQAVLTALGAGQEARCWAGIISAWANLACGAEDGPSALAQITAYLGRTGEGLCFLDAARPGTISRLAARLTQAGRDLDAAALLAAAYP
ncbi:MAG TPA: hypothetical protein VNL71_02240 [Chloroflexota bacterium]|nr:hypothetical protein [Chloroflexota bacterium]